MNSFEDRKKMFEEKLAYDERQKFEIRSRHLRLLAEWLCETIGSEGEEASEYVQMFISDHIVVPGREGVIEKLEADLAAVGHSMSRHRIEKRYDHLLEVATQQIKES